MTIEEINAFCRNTFIDFMGIEFIKFGDDFVEARMPVDAKKRQPMGVLHGGASLALAETVASAGSVLLTDTKRYDVFGMQVSGNHLATIKEGTVIARAEIIHKGSMTHVWNVKISDINNKLISVARVTNIIVEKKEER